MQFKTFTMERWQSRFEHRVQYNLSESGVHPLTLAELLELAADAAPGALGPDLGETVLGYGQSNGSDELRARIAELHPGANADSIVVTTGGAEANLTAAWKLVEAGKPVAVTLPNYMQIPGVIESLGGRIIPVHLIEEAGWQPDLDELARALEAGARSILITNPNNPTGATLTEDSMVGVADLAQRYGAWILADEVYRGAEVSGPETPSFWGRHDRVLITNSLSKAYGLPGLRVGWVATLHDVAADLWARKDYTTITVSTLSDRLAQVALTSGVRERILERTRTRIRDNLGILTDWMDTQEGLFSYRPPDAGAICYARYHARINSSELAERLRTEQDLLVVPGDHFGMDRYLRIGFGPPADELKPALDRLAAAFRDVQREG